MQVRALAACQLLGRDREEAHGTPRPFSEGTAGGSRGPGGSFSPVAWAAASARFSFALAPPLCRRALSGLWVSNWS